jgi:cobalamin biosynthesis Mg chelatase CobN
MRRPIIQPTTTPAFLGIGTGKRQRAKAEAAAKLEEERRKTLAAQNEADLKLLAAKTEAAKAGYKTPEQQKSEADVTAAVLDSQSSNTLYYILGAVVVAVMIGLYFIKRRAK